jgi:hypothetical protein
MGAKQIVTVEELCQIKQISPWRVRALIKQGLLQVRHIAGRPIKPYQIDLTHFDKIESHQTPQNKSGRSLKTEGYAKLVGHRRKEPLWSK